MGRVGLEAGLEAIRQLPFRITRLPKQYRAGKSNRMKRRVWKIKKGPIEEMDRSFDYEFWLSQPDGARSLAAWEMAVYYHVNVKGEDESKLRLQRTVAVLKPLPR